MSRWSSHGSGEQHACSGHMLESHAVSGEVATGGACLLVGGIDGQITAEDVEGLRGFEALHILRADGEGGLVGSRHCGSSACGWRSGHPSQARATRALNNSEGD